MKYKVGDRVLIKSLDWYNKNKDNYGGIYAGNGFGFWKNMTRHCGEIMKITTVKVDPEDSNKGFYFMENSDEKWTDEMIEGLVEEEIKSEPKFHIGDWATDGDVLAEDSCIFIIQKLGDNGTAAKTYCTLHNDGYFEKGSILYFDIDSTKPATEDEKQKLFRAIKDNGYKWNSETKTLEKLIEPLDVPTMTTEFVKEHGLPCPEGFIFKDENGNVINATKIVLEKKKKEYPKTYEECCKILGLLNVDLCFNADYRSFDASKKQWKRLGLMNEFYQLLICRDAYWKIAGEEMGLGKPWEPDWTDLDQLKYCIWVDVGEFVTMTNVRGQHILAFPTDEMRDAFYENFKELIEMCKELL